MKAKFQGVARPQVNSRISGEVLVEMPCHGGVCVGLEVIDRIVSHLSVEVSTANNNEIIGPVEQQRTFRRRYVHQGEEPFILLCGDTFGRKGQKNLTDVRRWIEELLLNQSGVGGCLCFIDVRVTGPALPAFGERASFAKRKWASREGQVPAVHLQWIDVYLNPDAVLPYSLRDTILTSLIG